MKLSEKMLAIELRKKGKSYSDIRKEIIVARGTLSRWLKDVPLTEKQGSLLAGRAKSRYAGAKANQRNAQQRNRRIIEMASKEAAQLMNDPFFLSGLMLYWAEGTKGGSTVAFTNSDPKMIKLIMRWFREICRVPEKKFRVLIFIHSLLVDLDWQEHWSEITKVSKSQFIRPYIKPTVTKHRKNKLYLGTCSIRVNDVSLLNKIKGWHAGALERLK